MVVRILLFIFIPKGSKWSLPVIIIWRLKRGLIFHNAVRLVFLMTLVGVIVTGHTFKGGG